MFVDYVYCGKCGRKLYVNIGAEYCPCCGKYGMLQWVDKDTPTIEIEHELQQRKIVAEVYVEGGVGYAVAEDEAEAVENAHRAATKCGDGVTSYDTNEIWYQEVTT